MNFICPLPTSPSPHRGGGRSEPRESLTHDPMQSIQAGLTSPIPARGKKRRTKLAVANRQNGD